MAVQFPYEIWRQLNGTDFRLLEQLTFLSKAKGYAYPSQKYLSKALRCHRSTITRSINKLKELGLLVVNPRKYRRKNGQFLTESNAYRVIHWIGWKVRSLFHKVTDVAKAKHKLKKKEKSLENTEKFLPTAIKNRQLSDILERFWLKVQNGPISPRLPWSERSVSASFP